MFHYVFSISIIEPGVQIDEMFGSAMNLTFVPQVGGFHWCLSNLVGSGG